MSTIVLVIYYVVVLIFTRTLIQNSDAECGTGSAALIILWGLLSIILTIVMIIIMAVKGGYSVKEYVIVLGLIIIPALIAIKWFFYS